MSYVVPWNAYGSGLSGGEERGSRAREFPIHSGRRRWRLPVRYGLARTARAISLEYYAIKRRLEQRSAAAGRHEPGAEPTFVELPPMPTSARVSSRWSWKTRPGRRCGFI